MTSPATRSSSGRFMRHNLAIVAAVNIPMALVVVRDLAIHNGAAVELSSALEESIRERGEAAITIPGLESATRERLTLSSPSSLRVARVQITPGLDAYRATATPRCWLLTRIEPALSVHASAFASAPARE